MKDLTVYVITHNRPDLVLNAVNSILNQTCHDFKFIVSDNSNDDETYKLLKKMGLLNKLDYKRRIGADSAKAHFEICRKEVDTTFFLFFHDDDVMFPTMIEELYKRIEKSDYVAVACNACFLDNDIMSKRFFLPFKKDVVINSPKKLSRRYLEGRIVPFPAYMYRKDVPEFNYDCGKYSDVTSLLKVAEFGKIFWVGKPLMAYRIHSGQDSSCFDFISSLLLTKHFRHWCGDSKILKQYRFACLKHCADIRGHKINNAIVRKYSKSEFFLRMRAFIEFVYTHSPKEILMNIKGKIKKLYIYLLRMFFVNKNLIVMRMDGGICSQMYQYAYGQLLANAIKERNKKVVVKYNVAWFYENGFDLLGEGKYYFDLEKLFPNIKVLTATKKEIMVYKKYYQTSATDFDALRKMEPPLCLDKYYSGLPNFWPKYGNAFFSLNPCVLNSQNQEMLKKIQACPVSCGIHVRRGDLAVPEIAKKSGRGAPVNIAYFLNAVDIIEKLCGDTTFFIFSDRLEYVKEELLPKLNKKKTQYILVDINPSENGYMDLFLLAHCHHQIASIGSHGYVSHFLNKNDEKILVTSQNDCFCVAKRAFLLDVDGKLIDSKGVRF